ncbi:MAG: mannitol-1-phosphate 5-dehydrogenase, partial [Atribacterota bacterium]|nr:mannitol-1-phosphate 5-dehydrogenase [Atribacterota bacterium]
MAMMLLQFGAGNIGRGFMGHLFREAGYEVLFVESDDNLVRLLNERRTYPLRLLDAYKKEVIEFVIRGVKAVSV